MGTARAEDPVHFPAPMLGGSGLPITQVPGSPMPLVSVGTCSHVHTSTDTLLYTHTHNLDFFFKAQHGYTHLKSQHLRGKAV